jgi:hypothetical protein
MAKIVDASPKASSEIEMLSSIGYSLNSAISDIIDNSIHALHLNEQKNPSIHINIPPGTETPQISILDNGIGMNEQELHESMIIGCKNPNDIRGEMDLGRFGSGLKTASFSQASVLTVVTKKLGKLSGARFDKDRIKQTDRWDLELLEKKDLKKINTEELLKSESGTLVIWNNLEKYKFKDNSHQDTETLIALDILSLKKHLSHFFHKFMGKKGISFYVNGECLIPFDPFLTRNKGYQEGIEEKVRVSNKEYVSIKYHIIPHISKMTKEEEHQLGGKEELTSKQGLYIYRANRLIVEGNWMGIAPKTEMNGLVRIEMHVPTTLDKEWDIDVKKTELRLPNSIRSRMKRLSLEPRKRSKRSITYRGNQEKVNDYWDINDDKRQSIITYGISSENKEIKELVNQLNKKSLNLLNVYLKELAMKLPLNHIANSVNVSPKDIQPELIDFAKLEEELKKIWKSTK